MDTLPTTIFVDADACPVKEETYRVAKRYGLPVVLVANQWVRTPREDWIELKVVGSELDAADDWIAENASRTDIVITSDIPLAARCLDRGARVLGPKGRPFDEQSIGGALATRELMSQLRDMGEMTGGPAPFTNKDRSQFLQALDAMVHALRRESG